MYLYERLAPVQGARTINVYYDKIDDCRALWEKYGFTSEENEAIPGLIDNLRTEWALISVDRKPNFTATQQDQPTEQQAKVAEPKEPTNRAGRKPTPWEPWEIEVDKLKSQGKTPSEIRDALKVKYPVLTRQKVAKIIDKLRKRKRRGNGPK
jgi:hypothetical protein